MIYDRQVVIIQFDCMTDSNVRNMNRIVLEMFEWKKENKIKVENNENVKLTSKNNQFCKSIFNSIYELILKHCSIKLNVT